MDNITLILGVIQVVMIIVTGWVALRRLPAQNISDASMAAANLSKSLNEEIKRREELEQRIAVSEQIILQLQNIIENAHIEMGIEVAINKAPVFTGWKWTPIEKQKSPA